LLIYEKLTDTRARVYGMHHQPDKLSVEQKSAGILLDDKILPVAEAREGQNAVLYCNPKTQEVWVEYEDRPLTAEELLTAVLRKQDEILTRLETVEAKLTAK
jgi:hypothetical protein